MGDDFIRPSQMWIHLKRLFEHPSLLMGEDSTLLTFGCVISDKLISHSSSISSSYRWGLCESEIGWSPSVSQPKSQSGFAPGTSLSQTGQRELLSKCLLIQWPWNSWLQGSYLVSRASSPWRRSRQTEHCHVWSASTWGKALARGTLSMLSRKSPPVWKEGFWNLLISILIYTSLRRSVYL